MDERSERLRSSKGRFIETYREIVLEEQPLGPPLEREIIVIRVDKPLLKLYGWGAIFIVSLLVLSFIFGA